MEDKKLNELNDEALDAVTGGASYQWNEETKEYDVFDMNGKKIFSIADERIAKRMVGPQLMIESTLYAQQPSVWIPPTL